MYCQIVKMNKLLNFKIKKNIEKMKNKIILKIHFITSKNVFIIYLVPYYPLSIMYIERKKIKSKTCALFSTT